MNLAARCEPLARLGCAAISHLVAVQAVSGLRHIAGRTGAVAGPTLSITISPTDLTGFSHACHEASPGQILICALTEPVDVAVVGGLAALELRRAGFVALVVDGFVCDLSELNDAGIPIFARGLVPIAASLGSLDGDYQPGARIGGVEFLPGDIAVGDADGVIRVDPGTLDEIGAQEAALLERETCFKRELLAGRSLWQQVLAMKSKNS